MKVSGFFTALNMSASGLRNQRQKLDAISANIANVNTTQTDEGGPYRRKVVISRLNKQVQFKDVLSQKKLQMRATSAGHINPGLSRRLSNRQALQVESDVIPDQTPFRKVHNPSHPDADADGYVLMPNVNPLEEMVEMINASRSYEANVTVIEGFKAMAKEALNL